MSDAITKPTEPVTAEAPKVEETAVTAPAADTTLAAETTTEETKPAEESKPAEEPKKEEEKPEPKEITHGTLAKTHRGVLSFFKQKRYFYFQDDAVPEDKLRQYYLHKESASKPTAAHAAQTGKGLWFYSKDESHKDAPHGIVKLADVTEVVPAGANKFVLKLSAGELQFESPAVDRDNWVYTLKQKVEEAKASDKDIVESEEYKSTLEKFVKPVTAAKPVEKAGETKAEDTPAEETKEEENKTEEAAAATTATVPEAAIVSDEEAGPSDMKRSSSKKAKRASVFEKFKPKSHKAAEKESEAKPEVKEESKDEEEQKAAEPAAAAETTAVTLPASETAPGTEAVKPAEDKPAEEERPALATSPKEKRKSSFFSFGKKKEEQVASPSEEKKDETKPEEKKEEAGAEEPAKDIAEEIKPAESGNETAAAEPAKATDAPAVETETSPEEKAAPSSPKPTPKSFFSGFLAKREKSPGPKAAIEPTAETKTEVPAAESKADAPATEAVAETAVESPAAGEEPAEAATSPKEKRKSSFFAFKKPAKVEDVKSDSEDKEEKAAPKSSYVSGLIRKVSQRAGSSKPESKEVTTPAPVAEETEPSTAPKLEETAAEPAKEEAAKEDKPAEDKGAPVIGDVVPDAVNVGDKPAPVTA